MKKTRTICFCALFTALTAVGAFIRIPVPVVPFTLQFLFTMLAGLLLGGRRGGISVLVYLALGLVGLPIFTEGGGPWYIFKPTFGYLIGFAVAAFVTGRMAERNRENRLSAYLAANFVGLAIVYAAGMIYCYVISNFVLGTPLGLWPLVLYCFILVVPGDICLCILAAFLARRLCPLMRRQLQ